jgi:hypothetical protein
MSRGSEYGRRRNRGRRCNQRRRSVSGDCGNLRMRVSTGTGTTREIVRVDVGDCATVDNTTTTRRHVSPRCGLHRGLAIQKVLWGLTLKEDVGLEIVGRLGYMEIRRTRGAARDRWTNDGLVGRLGSHWSRWRRCKDVVVGGIWHRAKHWTDCNETTNQREKRRQRKCAKRQLNRKSDLRDKAKTP